jgi:hypothetical protein
MVGVGMWLRVGGRTIKLPLREQSARDIWRRPCASAQTDARRGSSRAQARRLSKSGRPYVCFLRRALEKPLWQARPISICRWRSFSRARKPGFDRSRHSCQRIAKDFWDFNIIGHGVASFGESDRSSAFPRSDLGPHGFANRESNRPQLRQERLGPFMAMAIRDRCRQ